MHVLFHTQYFPPEIGAPQARISELARFLHEKGVRVSILTGMPNYPIGKIYPGYGGFYSREELDYADVYRTWILPSSGYGFTSRLANYFSFVFSSLIFGLIKIQKPDFIITESPPLFLGISGFLLGKWFGAKWIFNISDLWPESAVHLEILKDGKRLRFAYKLEAWLYKKADLVSGQSDGIVENIQKRFPRIWVEKISNGVDLSRFSINTAFSNKDLCSRYGVNGQLGIAYTGLHGKAQGLEQIINCASPMLNSNVHFVFVGDGPNKKQLEHQAAGQTNITFHDPVSNDQIPQILAAMDVVLVSLKGPIPGAVPSKLYEAMAAGKPVIFIGGGEGEKIVQKHEAGLVVPPSDPNALAEAIYRLKDDIELRTKLGNNGRKAAEKYYDREKISKRFYELLKEVAKK